MTQVTFYSLSEQDQDGQQLACQLAASLYGNKHRASVWCKDQVHAESLDELLWQAPSDRFVPHNLKGEGPQGGAPIEICWQEQSIRPRQTVVILAAQTLSNPNQFQHIIDFVPVEETAKQAARERYKYYQQSGCAMHFAKSDSVES